jgi:hypothetical protein
VTGFANTPAGSQPGLPHQQPDGTWQYPYVPGAVLVPQSELATGIGAPTYAAPTRPARDPRHATMAAVLTFVCLLLGLWGVLGFVGAMSKTLNSIMSRNAHVQQQLVTANEALDRMQGKTAALGQMRRDTDELTTALKSINASMGLMVTDVGTIGTGMTSLNGSLSSLGTQVDATNAMNAKMGPQLAAINRTLDTELTQVNSIHKDVLGSARVLATFPGKLTVTNSRIIWINGTVNFFGCTGLLNNVHVKLSFAGLGIGAADIGATIIPKGAWGTDQQGLPCQ